MLCWIHRCAHGALRAYPGITLVSRDADFSLSCAQAFGFDETFCLINRPFYRKVRLRACGAQAFGFDETFCLINRPFSRSQSRFFSVLRLSCSALPFARAISHFTRPPL